MVKVLVVDDDPIIRKLLNLLLVRFGCRTILEAENGNDHKVRRRLGLLIWLILAGTIAGSGYWPWPGPAIRAMFAREAPSSEAWESKLSNPKPGAAGLPSLGTMETITFSRPSVVTDRPFTLMLKSLVGGTIRYTTDGSLPLAAGMAYTAPITIARPTVIRAQVFKGEDRPVGALYTRSYIVADYEQTIPVISLVTDPLNLYWLHDYPEEHNQNKARRVSMAYFALGGQLQFTVNGGLQIFGGRAELYGPKKSYLLNFGQKHGGPGFLAYPLFEESPVTSFSSLVLRAGNNDPRTYLHRPDLPEAGTYFIKLIGGQVVRDLHRDMGQPAVHGRWVLLYLNGEFRGLYNLTEHIDEAFLRSYFGPTGEWEAIGKEARRMVDGDWLDTEIVLAGRPGSWQALQEWVDNADLSKPVQLAELEAAVDLENLFSVMFLQAYVQNYAWPGDEWVIFRRSDPAATAGESQWRVLIRDAEHNFGSGAAFRTDANTLTPIYSPNEGITRVLFKSFSSNCELKYRFIRQSRGYLGWENTSGQPEKETGQLAQERVRAEILRQAAIVRPFIQLEIDRWTPELSIEIFDQNIQNALIFIDERKPAMLRQLDALYYQHFTTCR